MLTGGKFGIDAINDFIFKIERNLIKYEVSDEVIIVKQCKGHYDDK